MLTKHKVLCAKFLDTHFDEVRDINQHDIIINVLSYEAGSRTDVNQINHRYFSHMFVSFLVFFMLFVL